MITNSWIYDGILYLTALSLLFFFSDLIAKSQRARRIGTGLLIVVWVLQTVFFLLRMIKLEYIPIYNMFEILFFFSWILISTSLLLKYFFRSDALVFFISMIAFIILVLNIFNDGTISLIDTGWEMKQEVVILHISLAVTSYAAFSVAAILAATYLFLHYRLKSRKWTKLMKRLPSLDRIEVITFRTVMIGMPLLFLSLLLSITWMTMFGGIRELFDPKVFNSLLILAAYGFYVFRRITKSSVGINLALWNLAAYAMIIINIVISNVFSGFHQWIWM